MNDDNKFLPEYVSLGKVGALQSKFFSVSVL